MFRVGIGIRRRRGHVRFPRARSTIPGSHGGRGEDQISFMAGAGPAQRRSRFRCEADHQIDARAKTAPAGASDVRPNTRIRTGSPTSQGLRSCRCMIICIDNLITRSWRERAVAQPRLDMGASERNAGINLPEGARIGRHPAREGSPSFAGMRTAAGWVSPTPASPGTGPFCHRYGTISLHRTA